MRLMGSDDDIDSVDSSEMDDSEGRVSAQIASSEGFRRAQTNPDTFKRAQMNTAGLTRHKTKYIDIESLKESDSESSVSREDRAPPEILIDSETDPSVPQILINSEEFKSNLSPDQQDEELPTPNPQALALPTQHRLDPRRKHSSSATDVTKGLDELRRQNTSPLSNRRTDKKKSKKRKQPRILPNYNASTLSKLQGSNFDEIVEEDSDSNASGKGIQRSKLGLPTSPGTSTNTPMKKVITNLSQFRHEASRGTGTNPNTMSCTSESQIDNESRRSTFMNN